VFAAACSAIGLWQAFATFDVHVSVCVCSSEKQSFTTMACS
jgi:hypothetical protein